MSEIETDETIVQYGNSWGQEEAINIAEVLEGDVLIEGQKVVDFEKKFAEFVGAKYCVLMPNPTLATYAALMVSRGKIKTPYVRIPDFGYIEVFNAVIMANMNPILCDVTESGVLELRDNEAGIAIHFNGRKAKPTVLEICFDTPDYHTKGLMSVYSFNYERFVSLGGKGGAVCTDSDDDYNNLVRFKDQGRLEVNSQLFDHWGIDLQVTEIQAAFGLAQLQLLAKKIESVRNFYNKIKDALSYTDKLVFLNEPASMWIDVYTKEPLKLAKFLNDNNILSTKLPVPLHTQPICANIARLDKEFTYSNTLYNAGLFLPSSPIMEDKQIDRIIDILKKYVETL